jgi:hypothetical protein
VVIRKYVIWLTGEGINENRMSNWPHGLQKGEKRKLQIDTNLKGSFDLYNLKGLKWVIR